MKETIHRIADDVNNGRIDPRERVSDALALIEQYEYLNATRFLLRDKAMAAAERLNQAIRGGKRDFPLAGVTVAVKDNIVTTGDECTAGSKILKSYISPYTATAVERLENAGAIVVAKTNMDEFAMGSSGENSAYGATGHPFDPSRVPGGSSSGSAVLAAVNAVDISLGSETGGSVRQPAAFCGVVGVKPTYGRVSRYGLIAFASSLDQIGVFANNVSDTEAALYAMAGADEHDATSAREPVPAVGTELDDGLQGLKIAVLKTSPELKPQSDVANAFDYTIHRMAEEGAEVDEVEFPLFAEAIATYYIICTAEASSNLARYDGGRYGARVETDGLRDTYKQTRGQGFGREVKRRILLGTFVLSSGFIDAYYRKAMLVRRKMANEYLSVMEKYDALVLPTSPTTAFKMGERMDDPVAMYLSDIYTAPANLIGVPAISVPFGVDENRLPIGMQVMAKPFAEARMFRVASALEHIHARS
ncbi:MAG: Asp-tRNA(Asn)/Glu-tRNA(Gln) amidotransferase subunit GatA [bacterium]|nr:Asp-tRNA(Asn)/Glu-tRNA(Gln) amidotransferase subunit GatA [bacterium]